MCSKYVDVTVSCRNYLWNVKFHVFWKWPISTQCINRIIYYQQTLTYRLLIGLDIDFKNFNSTLKSTISTKQKLISFQFMWDNKQ